jgi:hypothetical protein
MVSDWSIRYNTFYAHCAHKIQVVYLLSRNNFHWLWCLIDLSDTIHFTLIAHIKYKWCSCCPEIISIGYGVWLTDQIFITPCYLSLILLMLLFFDTNVASFGFDIDGRGWWRIGSAGNLFHPVFFKRFRRTSSHRQYVSPWPTTQWTVIS